MPQWTLFENDFRLIDGVLDDLLQRTNALSGHLIDRSGQIITSAGRVDDFDVTSFASLAAADFTANAELAQLMGEPTVDAVVNEGRRTRSKRGADQLDRVFRELFEKVGLADSQEPAFEAAPDFAAAASNEVDALFGE